MDSIKYKFKLANFILGFLSWFAVNTAAWYTIWWLQPPIINHTSSADQKHFIDFWLNLLPWLFFLIVIVFLMVKRQWIGLAGWVAATLSNIVALIFLLPGLADTGVIPPIGQGLYLLFNIPVSALLIPNVVDLLYLWLL
jgi:hypothetical protein